MLSNQQFGRITHRLKTKISEKNLEFCVIFLCKVCGDEDVHTCSLLFFLVEYFSTELKLESIARDKISFQL